MNLLCPVVTVSGWIYSIGSLYSKRGNLFGRPMYFPSEAGERVYSGRRYDKFLRHQRSDLLPKQPYIRCAQIDPWSVMIPAEHIVGRIDSHQVFENWLTSSDSRVGIVKGILQAAGIASHQCGLGGSVSLGCEALDFDIDLLIFNSSSAHSCRRAIEDALLNRELELMTKKVVSSYAERYAKMYGLDQGYLHSVFAGDLTKVYYQGQKISFIFTYGEDERDKIPARLYDDDSYLAPEIRMNAHVIDSAAAWLFPRKYVVQKPSGQIYQVWSHHWLRDPVTPAGTLVEVVGRDLGDGIISLTDMHHHIAP